MRKLYIIGGLLIGVLGIASLTIYQNQYKKAYMEQVFEEDNFYYEKYENQCLAFVKAHNLIEQPEVDTKSLGLYMEYILKNHTRIEFDQLLAFLKEYLLQEDGLIMGKVHMKEEVGAANNALESMVVMNTLMGAYEKWGDTTYRDMALNIERSLYEHNVKEGYLYSLYNTVTRDTDQEIQIKDLNLRGMVIFSEYRDSWKNVFNQSKQLIQKAYISETLPFYYGAYDKTKSGYVMNKTINMEESMQIILNLSEVGLVKAETINWLKENLKAGALYEEYDVATGKAVFHTEDPVIYAMIAQAGKILGDNELYTLAIEKMLNFQVKDKENNAYGALLKGQEQKAVLYDNIQALLAF
ncbi:MAG: hypothetical protein ACRCW2_07350 [Cellulosilyticaceae bacterium]